MAKEKAEKGEKKDLASTLSELQKKYGVMSIGRLGDKPEVVVDVISTGSRGLNKAIGAGGFPKGRIIELWGLEASGKTLIALSAAAECQRTGGKVAFIDAEHAFNAGFARTLGVDVENLIYSQPDYGEQALDMVETLLENNVVDYIIVDSVAGLVPQKELEGEMGDSFMGLQARMMGQAMRKLTGPAAKSNTAVVFINQIREKIGVAFGDPRTTTGGNALKYYASLRMEVRRVATLKSGDTVIGHRAAVKVVKNKVGQPHGEAQFNLYYADHAHPGIDMFGELVEEAIAKEIIDKAGAWYSFKGERLGQGEENTKNFIRGNEKIKAEILAALGAS